MEAEVGVGVEAEVSEATHVSEATELSEVTEMSEATEVSEEPEASVGQSVSNPIKWESSVKKDRKGGKGSVLMWLPKPNDFLRIIFLGLFLSKFDRPRTEKEEEEEGGRVVYNHLQGPTVAGRSRR